MRSGQGFQNSDKRACKTKMRKKNSNTIILTYLSIISQYLTLSCGSFYIKPETILKIKATKP